MQLSNMCILKFFAVTAIIIQILRINSDNVCTISDKVIVNLEQQDLVNGANLNTIYSIKDTIV